MGVTNRAALTAVVLAMACVDPARLNTGCDWTERDARPLDVSKRADRSHLREDARVVGEIEVRFADARRKTPAEMEPLVDECRAKLVPIVTAGHHVTVGDLERARHARNWAVDILLVFVPAALLTILTVSAIVRRVCGMFDADSGRIAAVVAGALVPVSAAVITGVTQIWGFTVDGLLLRNGHLSFRAFYNPATVHGWIAYFSALALCGAAALWRFRRTPLTGHTGGYRPALVIKRPR
jgi:hypothetical protein